MKKEQTLEGVPEESSSGSLIFRLQGLRVPDRTEVWEAIAGLMKQMEVNEW